jgi:hypothetical protein
VGLKLQIWSNVFVEFKVVQSRNNQLLADTTWVVVVLVIVRGCWPLYLCRQLQCCAKERKN